ncbi:MAG: polymer-forming cytoskeletal protein [Rhodovibrionaceae bacterium]|nr:polymer-forming cytoskeletal protein [Rhodovibrionaceae bacterium]
MNTSSKSGTQTGASSGAPQAGKKSSGVPSIISTDLTIRGNLESRGDIQVDGEVEGDIASQTLTIGESAVVHGGISADSARICGTVHGEIKATTVVLTKTARVTGDVVHQNLTIEAGAFLEGHCRRLEAERAGSGAKVQPAGSGSEKTASAAQPAQSGA